MPRAETAVAIRMGVMPALKALLHWQVSGGRVDYCRVSLHGIFTHALVAVGVNGRAREPKVVEVVIDKIGGLLAIDEDQGARSR